MIALGRRGDLSGQRLSLVKAAGERDPSVMPPVGDRQPVRGVQNPRSSNFPAPEKLLFSPGRAAQAPPLCQLVKSFDDLESDGTGKMPKLSLWVTDLTCNPPGFLLGSRSAIQCISSARKDQ